MTRSDHSDSTEDVLAAIRQTKRARSYAEMVKCLTTLQGAITTFSAAQLQPLLNQHAASLPQDTLGDKQQLCREINETLRELRLAVKCPRTGRSAKLRAEAGHDPDVGRFQLQLTESRAGGVRTVSRADLPALELTGDEIPDRFPNELRTGKARRMRPSPGR